MNCDIYSRNYDLSQRFEGMEYSDYNLSNIFQEILRNIERAQKTIFHILVVIQYFKAEFGIRKRLFLM